MKFIKLLIFTFICHCAAFSQSTFAPVGAVWYNDMYHGIFRTTVVADTVIDGTPCRKVIREAGVNLREYINGLKVYDLRTLYIYNNDDTVFIYNDLITKFSPLYVFNVKTGDTVTLPFFTPDAQSLMQKTDSFFSIVIDSVKNMQYSMDSFETVFSHPLSDGEREEFEYTSGYARTIGSISTGLLPSCNRCIFYMSESLQAPGPIRCYSDKNIAVKLAQGDCDSGIKVSVNDVALESFNLFPNPARNTTRLVLYKDTTPATLNITDITGRIVNTINFSGKSVNIDLSSLSPGTYFTSLYHSGNLIYFSKLMVLP